MKPTVRTALNKIDAGVILVAALALFAGQALLKPGLPTTADLPVHLYRALEFERAWAAGVLVPRWAPNLAYGYGYPLFIFAPPLPYVLAMLFHLPGPITIETAFKLLLVVTLLLYAVGMYLLARDLWGSVAAGLVAAVAFTFAPFALREVLLSGGNVPQYLAIGLFPWPLWAAGQSARTGQWRWTALSAIFFAAIVLSHLFQALVFAPLFGLYLLLLAAIRAAQTPPPRPVWTLLKPPLAALLGLLLAAYFWLPAFVERYATRAQADIYLEKSPFFVRYPYLPELLAWIQPLDTRAANPYVPLTLGVVTLALAGLGLLALVIARPRLRPSKNNVSPSAVSTLPLLLLAVAGAAAIFMTLPVSRRVWETVSVLQVAEFPWRMLGLANLGLAALAGGAMRLVPAKIRFPVTALVVAGQLLAVGPYLYPTIGFTRYGEPTLADQLRYERSSQSIGTTTLGEYLPKTVTKPPTTSPLVDSYLHNQIPDRLDRASLPAGAQADLLAQSAITHRYRLNAPEPFTLRLYQFYFPGWQARLDGQPTAINPEAATGLMRIDIPARPHTLTVSFENTPVRQAANAISGLTLLGLGVAGGLAWRKKWTGQRPPASPVQPVRLPLSGPTVAVAAGVAVAALLVGPWLRPLFTMSSPRHQILPAQVQTSLRFANGIELAGYTITQNPVKIDGYTQVILYWQTDKAPYRDNLQPFVHLDRLDDFTTVADATNYTPGDVTTESNVPTFHWDNRRYVRDEHDILIPPNTPPQAYAVRVGLIDPAQNGRLVPLADGSGDTAWLDIINVAPAGPSTVQLARPLRVEFSDANGDTITLTGFELTGVTPERVDFKLTWQATHRPRSDAVVFAQLLDASGQLAASYDRPPLDGAYPTSTWLPGQTILDPRFIPLVDVSPGRYRLIVGLYDAATGQRWVRPDGTDFVELTTVRVDR